MELRKDNRPILSFAKLESPMPMPNLLDVQLRSFEKLVDEPANAEEQWDFGLDRVFVYFELFGDAALNSLEREPRTGFNGGVGWQLGGSIVVLLIFSLVRFFFIKKKETNWHKNWKISKWCVLGALSFHSSTTKL